MSVPDVLPPSPHITNHRDRVLLPAAIKPVMTTPDDSPASFTPSSSANNRRRVGFLPWPNLVDPLSSTPSSEQFALKALPPSRDCQKSARSILKPYSEPVVSVASTDGSSDMHIASPETIEAIAQQLASGNKGSSLDAYQTLSQIIKAYDEIPEDVNIRGCIASILRSIRRDLSIQESIHSSPIDTNLMTQALKVSVILVWSGFLSPLLTDDFRVFIVDRSINALAEHSVPKVVIIHYMHLLAVQNFRAGILSSNNRTVKLLEALQDITNHVQGKGAVAERLLIYQKLIEQAKPIMQSRASLWIKEVLLGLSSSVKDIRDKAISVGNRACSAFPSSPTISTAAREALASKIPDQGGNTCSLNVLLTQRLEKMVAAKDEAIQVPQIWALAMLLCSSPDSRVDGWTLLKDWLKVIQRCFNCSDISVKSQAFPAWNRFIHICRPHDASEIMVSMLAKPIVVQIERTSANMTGKGLRPAAVSSYCMLLYHAFRPAASHRQYTRMWNEYIVKIMGTHFVSKSTANADLCSRIIMALMWKDSSSSSRIWNENRAHENTLLEPEDLPTIDCKWIRSKTEAIIQILRLLFKHSFWGPSVQHSDQAYVAKAWRHFLKAIRESGSKEIKASAETKRSLSLIMLFIQELSDAASQPPVLDDTQGRLQLLCSLAINELGAQSLLEAMETETTLQSPIIIGQLLQVAAGSSTMARSDHALSKPGYSGTNSGLSLERLLNILDTALEKAYQNHQSGSTHLLLTLNLTCKTLRAALGTKVLPRLAKLQTSLSIILEDERNIVKLQPELSPLIKQWKELSLVVFDRITSLDLSCYPQLDDLLAASLSSNNIFTQNAILDAWSKMSGSNSRVGYGPKLSKAIGLMQRKTEVALPGIRSIQEHSQTGVERNIQSDFVVAEQQNIDSHHSAEINNSSTGSNDHFIHSRANATTIAERNDRKEPLLDATRKMVRHDDSQVEFVPVDSSPGFADEPESQLLTERQKEVRDRQRAEQTVTFPDLRSSPRPRSARGSRAPSADCEMARKVAALEKLPSTPTINRQQGAVDEAELPTPTPKARNRTLEVVDVEIPSSPPSVADNRNANFGPHDVLSSPPKILEEMDADVVDLEDMPLLKDDLVHDLDEADKGAMKEKAIHDDKQSDERAVAFNPCAGVVAAAATPRSVGSNLSSTVLETVQEAITGPLESEERPQDAPTFADSDLTDVADDIDELSASQLSQSLSQHVAQEPILLEAPAEPAQRTLNKQKRRKRPTSGYADQDRKKRRRRVLSNETSLSSMVSEDSNLGCDDAEAEDCVIVSAWSTVTPSRRPGQTSDEANGDDRSSFTGSTGKRGGRWHKKMNHIPLHIKLGNSQSTEEAYNETKVREDVSHADATGSPRLNSVQTGGNPTHHGERVSLPKKMDVMTALKTALNGLENLTDDQRANLDLEAIDSLCFKIRYQAQEIVQRRN